jgi:hypothetical protein
MTFITLIILGVVSLQSSNLAIMNGQKNEIQAHFLANQGVQIIKAIGYPALPTCNSTCEQKLQLGPDSYTLVPISLPDNKGEEIVVGNQTFTRTIELVTKPHTNENDPNSPIMDATKVKSIVEWEDSTGKHDRADDSSQAESDLIVFE